MKKKKILKRRKRIIGALYLMSWVTCWFGVILGLNVCLDQNLPDNKWFSINIIATMIIWLVALLFWALIDEAFEIPVNAKKQIRDKKRKNHMKYVDHEIRISELEKLDRPISDINMN
jgi:hypothetical protein